MRPTYCTPAPVPSWIQHFPPLSREPASSPPEDLQHSPLSLHCKVASVVARFKELRPNAGEPKRLFLGIRECQQFTSLRASGLRLYEFKDPAFVPLLGGPLGEFCGMRVYEVAEINYCECLP